MVKTFKQERVLKELASDQEPALEALFEYYYPRLYNFSRTILKMDEGIDDILQEVFLKIWDNRYNIATSETFNAYIFKITRNLLLNELRSRINDQKKRDSLLQLSVAEEYRSGSNVEYMELKEKLEEIIENLPPNQKEIFRLSRIEGLTHKEIAEKLSVSTKTVEYHITQSISIIKSKLKSFGLLSLLYLYLFF